MDKVESYIQGKKVPCEQYGLKLVKVFKLVKCSNPIHTIRLFGKKLAPMHNNIPHTHVETYD